MKHIDTSPLEARMKKLEMMRELVTDPEMVNLFLRMVTANGHKTLEAARTAAKSNTAKNVKTQRGELLAAARKVLPSLPATFNSRDLIKAVKASGYVFAAKSEGIAISGVLKRLLKKSILKRADMDGSRRNAKYKLAA
jgi:hypothetical protein